MSQQLSTATLVMAVGVEADWDRQVGILEELQNRQDLFNLQPILALSVQEGQHSKVRRTAVECAALHNSAFTVRWLTAKADNARALVAERQLALHGLAAVKAPSETLPVLERIAAAPGPSDIRIEAIGLIGRFRNIRSIGLLTLLQSADSRAVGDAARRALDDLVERNGGIAMVIERLSERAEHYRSRGLLREASDVLEAALRLDRHNGRLLYQLARLRVA